MGATSAREPHRGPVVNPRPLDAAAGPRHPRAVLDPVTLVPIGVMRTEAREKAEAARQPYAADGARGVIELLPGHGFEDALCDLDRWTHVWVLFVFHRNDSWRPKVMPPRSRGVKRGVFATRSPHRPNPLGMSVLKLLRVEGLCVHVEGVDLLDGTPVLDLKPYVPFVDAIPDASTGWIALDPEAPWSVAWSERAATQRDWLASHGEDLTAPAERALRLGPAPHAYRRIRATPDGHELAVRDWRLDFTAGERTLTVTAIRSGYRPSRRDEAPALHRAYADHFNR